MQEITGDLFNPSTYRSSFLDNLGSKDIEALQAGPDAICITTNGFVKKSDGECVMGRGCALTAKKMIPDLPHRLGKYLNQYGNRVFDMGRMSNGMNLVTFPVKPSKGIANSSVTNVVKHMRKRFKHRDIVPGWAMVADISIIKRSARQLVELADKRGWKHVVLPRPGAGAGELEWNDVKPILESILDDRFYCITFRNM